MEGESIKNVNIQINLIEQWNAQYRKESDKRDIVYLFTHTKALRLIYSRSH